MVHVIDRRFERAATWMFIGAALSFVGMIHSFSISSTAVMSSLGFPTSSVDGQRFAVVYVGVAFIMIFFLVRDGGDTGYLELRQRIQKARCLIMPLSLIMPSALYPHPFGLGHYPLP